MVKIRQLFMVVLLLAQGIFEVLKSVNNLEELEGQIQALVQKAAGMLLVEALQGIDSKLGGQRDTAELKNIGMRSRTIITGRWEILRQVIGDTAIEPQAKVTEKDLEAWLGAAVPALKGPFADKP